jgi:hypothetical protein
VIPTGRGAGQRDVGQYTGGWPRVRGRRPVRPCSLPAQFDAAWAGHPGTADALGVIAELDVK